jgi:hypothetical protein
MGTEDGPYAEDLVDLTPVAVEDAPEPAHDPRWLGPLLVLGLPTALVGVVGAALYYLLVLAPDFPESDSRACAGSTEPLEPAARRTGLQVPEGADDLHYLTSTEPGKPPFRVVFSIPQEAAPSALRSNGLTHSVPMLDDGWWTEGGMCGVTEGGVAAWTGSLPGSREPVRARVSAPGEKSAVQVLLVIGA